MSSHYEKLDGIERCIDDEIPFEIPESWTWVRLKSLGVSQTGNTSSKTHAEYTGKDIPFITPGDILNGAIDYDNQGLSLLGKGVARICPANSILQVCIGGSIGKAAVTDREVTYNQQINSLTPFLCDVNYIFAAMTSVSFLESIQANAGGTATPIINRGLWDMLLVPLPPLDEQHRIVKKLDKVLSSVQEL